MADASTIIGRLQKKTVKLQKQRDFFRQQCAYYAEVMRLHPSVEDRYTYSKERSAERERVKQLEARVKEQALLIEKLWKETP